MQNNSKINEQTKTQGFTLVELIVVIVILGILAATAIPKYLDSRRQARIAAIKGMEGALLSAVQANQAMIIATVTKPSRIYVMSDGKQLSVAYPNTASYGRPDTKPNGIGYIMDCKKTASLSIGGYSLYDCQGFTTMFSDSDTVWNASAFFVPPSVLTDTVINKVKCYVEYRPEGFVSNEKLDPSQFLKVDTSEC